MLTVLILWWQAESWIEERIQKLEDSPFQSLSNLSDKMKLLQKHQAFETEILAHMDLIATVNMVTFSLCNT